MPVKEFMQKLVEEKRNQIENLETALIESEDKEERAKLGETLTRLREELDEAEKVLAGEEQKEEEEAQRSEEQEKEQERQIIGTYTQRAAVPVSTAEQRAKQLEKELEERGKALKEKRAVKVSSEQLVLPKHTGSTINDTFTPVSTLVDQVNTENLNGGDSYEEPYVKSYAEGGITEEGADYADAEPEFDYAPMDRIKITAYAEISKEVKKLPNADYARKVQEACYIALKKKLSSQLINGTGTKQLYGIFGSPKAIDAGTDVELEAIDQNTLNTAVFSYGGDEEVETQATLILNKKTLKALSEVKKANGDPAYDIDVKNRTINKIPYTINSNVKDFTTASNGEFVMAYGNLMDYKMVTFSPVEIEESTDFKFKQGMICYRADVMVGGNVVKQNGFLRLKKKTA